MSIDKIRNEIENIKDDESKLYSYLYDLTYLELSKNARLLETVYVSFLKDSRSEIKRVAIYCLLFGLQIQKPGIKEIALKELRDKQNDIDLRLTCITGLAQAYIDTDDREILSVFYSQFVDEEEEDDARSECFVGMMKLHGLNSVQIVGKNKNQIIMSLEDLHFDEFEKELSEIRRIVA
ncbi:hypothetical protein ACX0G9_19405 [Flavitalea flava]